MITRTFGTLISVLAVTLAAAGCASHADEPIPVRAMVVTMFDPEAKPWVDRQRWTHEIALPGIRTPVRCNDSGLCMMVTGEGKVNAALSVSTMLASPKLNLDKAYFITAGIGGTPPTAGTLGFAAWANWVVDVDLGHHILPQDDPAAPNGYLSLGDSDKPVTQAYQLNGVLVDEVYRNTKDVALADDPGLAAVRAAYPAQAGHDKPFVAECDSATGDNFFSGAASSTQTGYIVGLQTGGKAHYCTTQMEDNATAGALARAGKLDRYVDLRTASDFDQPPAGGSVTDLLNATYTGFAISVENAYRVGLAAANYLVERPN
ncbi:purine nucleoside permease [Nocardia sp. CA2R105]|uniref:purine-nucleoside phosphorylase n=1 Tax=Nocardia coffeae TaxID=2873381 RepID=UPI001CA67168|nr:purine nucleoside permease [Nocardia coffeae]MBY8863625.1 purine nucleoside permease [Nocardia coffeae]